MNIRLLQGCYGNKYIRTQSMKNTILLYSILHLMTLVHGFQVYKQEVPYLQIPHLTLNAPITISTNQKTASLQNSGVHSRISSRLLQDNPFSPTGEIMTTTPGVKPNDDVLTIGLINQITQQNGSSTANSTVNPNGTLYQTNSNTSSLNISISGQSNNTYNNISSVFDSQAWKSTQVDAQIYNPSWIAANTLLLKLNLSYYYPNQILLLTTQNNSLGAGFNVTYKSVRGIARAVILVNQSYVPTLLSSSVLNIQPNPVNNLSILYNVTLSLLQSLFYDFTLSPLTLLNGTQTNVSGFVVYDLYYRSKNGIYQFVAKTQIYPNMSIMSTVLACNPITVSVTTQTVPVLASINIINVDGNFKFINQTVYDFVGKNLNISNPNITYNSVVIWCNRAGSAILYYLNISITPSASTLLMGYSIGVNFNLMQRQKTVTYWRSVQPPIPSYNANVTDYQQVSYLQILNDSIFMNVDLSARTNYPNIIVGPLVEIQVNKNVNVNGTGYRLTYLGVKGQNVQAAYNP